MPRGNNFFLKNEGEQDNFLKVQKVKRIHPQQTHTSRMSNEVLEANQN